MRKRGFFWWGIIIFFSVVLTGPAQAGEVVTKDARFWAQKALAEEKVLPAMEVRNTLAVLYFQNKTGQPALDALQKGLTLMLITDLSAVKGLQVVERVRMQALVEEMGLGVSGLVEKDTAPRLGRLLRAQWLVGGDIFPGKPDQLKIQSYPLDVPAQKILGQPAAEGLLADFFQLEKELLFGIIGLLKIEITPEEDKKLRKLCSTNMRALMELFKGIEASDRANYEKAAEFYEKALQEDPGICVAKGALEQLKDLGLIAVKKRSREMLRSLRDRTSLTDQLPPEETTKRVKTPKEIPSPVTIDIRFR